MKVLSLLKPESTNKAIVFSMGFSLLAKAFNFGQSVVVSYAFGAQTATDILFYVLAVIISLTSVINQINQHVIVPNAVEIREKRSEEDSKVFIANVYFFYLAIGIAISALLMLFPEKALQLFSRFSPTDISQNIGLIRYILPSFMLIIANTYILDIFSTYRYFTMPMFLDMLKNAVIILSVLIFHRGSSVQSLAAGIFAGNLVQFVLLNFLLFFGIGCRFRFVRFTLDRKIKHNIIYVVVGQTTTFLMGFAAAYLITGFDSGTYSAMDYSQKINTVFNQVMIGQITMVVGMNILELHSRGRYEAVNEVFLRYLKLSIFFLLPFCFIVALNAEPFVSLVFERGRFTREAVENTADFLRYFIFTLPFYLLNGFVVRLIIAKQIQRVSFWWNLFQSLANIIVTFAMIRVFGPQGYPMGFLLVNYTYVLLVLIFLVGTQFKYIDRQEAVRYLILNGLLNFGIFCLLQFIVGEYRYPGSAAGKLSFMGATAAAYLLAYGVLGYFTRLNRRVGRQVIEMVRPMLVKGLSGKVKTTE